MVAGGLEATLFETLIARCRTRGLLKVGGQQRDPEGAPSTHVLAKIRALNRIELVGETMRQALNALAMVAPDWLRPHLSADWADRYGPRVDDYRLPKGQQERTALAETMGQDGTVLLSAVYAPTAPTWLREIPAVETLRQVWVQQYTMANGHVR